MKKYFDKKEPCKDCDQYKKAQFEYCPKCGRKL